MTTPRAQVPYAPPTGPRAMAVALGAVALGLANFLAVPRWSSVRYAVGAAVYVAGALLACAFSARARSLGRAMDRVLVGSALATVAAQQSLAMQSGRFGSFDSLWPGVLFAAFAGAVAGLFLAPVPAAVAEARGTRAYDAFNVVLGTVGVWLALVGGLTSFGVVALDSALRLANFVSARDAAYYAMPVVTLACGLVVTFVAIRLHHRRLRWLEAVYAGRDAVWQVMPLAEFPGAAQLPPLISGDATHDGVLVFTAQTGALYRSGDGPEPLARVDLAPARMLARSRQTLYRLIGASLAVVAVPAVIAALVSLAASATRR